MSEHRGFRIEVWVTYPAEQCIDDESELRRRGVESMAQLIERNVENHCSPAVGMLNNFTSGDVLEPVKHSVRVHSVYRTRDYYRIEPVPRLRVIGHDGTGREVFGPTSCNECGAIGVYIEGDRLVCAACGKVRAS